MIVMTCRLIPQAGKGDACREAARFLSARSLGHTVAYLWSADQASGDLHLVEVHKDEASLLHHVEVSDVSDLAASGSFADIAYYGDAPSETLLRVLSGFGDVRVRTEV
jgi:hypothetical protein